MNKYLLYRITSKVNDKPRLDGFSKLDCLDNLLAAFPEYKVICIADNCDNTVLTQLQQKNFYKLVKTNLGNSKSFRYILSNELSLLCDEDLVYFVEDDYLHKENAGLTLEEGLQYFDYVTLYDHPDKYGKNRPHINPLVEAGLLSEQTQIVKGMLSLWRTTNSTTMTFGCFVRTIKLDLRVWNFFTSISSIPRDFHIRICLIKVKSGLMNLPKTMLTARIFYSILNPFKKGRTLGLPIPSVSAHLEVGNLPDNFSSEFGFKPNQINKK